MEVWDYDEDVGVLKRVQGGWWRSELFPDSARTETQNEQLSFDNNKITTLPGVGLAGTLWAETPFFASLYHRTDSFGGVNALRGHSLSRQHSNAHEMRIMHHHPHHHELCWRNIDSLVQDPDTAVDERLDWYQASGFGWAVGIPYQSWVHKGIVLFLARHGANPEKLSSIENQVYLACSAQIIGSIIAATDARRASILKKTI